MFTPSAPSLGPPQPHPTINYQVKILFNTWYIYFCVSSAESFRPRRLRCRGSLWRRWKLIKKQKLFRFFLIFSSASDSVMREASAPGASFPIGPLPTEKVAPCVSRLPCNQDGLPAEEEKSLPCNRANFSQISRFSSKSSNLLFIMRVSRQTVPVVSFSFFPGLPPSLSLSRSLSVSRRLYH